MLVSNLGLVFGVLSDTIEVLLALAMMLGGIVITHLIQRWADRAGEQPAAANVGFGGHPDRREPKTIRE